MTIPRVFLGLKALSAMSGIFDIAAGARAGSFNGTNSELTAASSDYRISDSAGAVSFWFSGNTTAGRNTVFCAVDTAASNRSLEIMVFGDDIRIEHKSPSGRGAQTDTVSTQDIGLDSNTYHVVAQSNGSAYSVYVNGELKSLSVVSGSNSGDWFADLTSGVDGIRWGVFENSLGKTAWFGGTLDEAIVFNSVLNSAEVNTLYNSGSGVRIENLEAADAALYAKAVNGWAIDTNSPSGIGDDLIGSVNATASNVTDVSGLI